MKVDSKHRGDLPAGMSEWRWTDTDVMVAFIVLAFLYAVFLLGVVGFMLYGALHS